MDQLDFVHMRPAPEIVRMRNPASGSVLVLAQDGRTYVLYLCHGRRRKARGMSDAEYTVDSSPQQVRLGIVLPAGTYSAVWIDTGTGAEKKRETVRSTGAVRTVRSPVYSEDIVLRIDNA